MRDVRIIQDLLSANGVKPTGSSKGRQIVTRSGTESWRQGTSYKSTAMVGGVCTLVICQYNLKTARTGNSVHTEIKFSFTLYKFVENAALQTPKSFQGRRFRYLPVVTGAPPNVLRPPSQSSHFPGRSFLFLLLMYKIEFHVPFLLPDISFDK